MIDFSCITTMLVLIKTSQVGLMPITASRPYGCFPPQCVLADLYTSLTHDAGHRWKLSSAELLLTAGRPAITQSLPAWTSATVLPCFAFCFCFSLSRMPAFGWSPGLPPCLLPYYIQCVSAVHHLGRLHIQSTQSLLLGGDNRDGQRARAAACCWPLNHSEGAQDASAVVHSCMFAWLLKLHVSQKATATVTGDPAPQCQRQEISFSQRKLQMIFEKADQ